jgi:hypothetical protein
MGRRPKSCAPFTQVRFGEEQMPPDQSRGIEQTPPQRIAQQAGNDSALGQMRPSRQARRASALLA